MKSLYNTVYSFPAGLVLLSALIVSPRTFRSTPRPCSRDYLPLDFSDDTEPEVGPQHPLNMRDLRIIMRRSRDVMGELGEVLSTYVSAEVATD